MGRIIIAILIGGTVNFYRISYFPINAAITIEVTADYVLHMYIVLTLTTICLSGAL